MARVRRIKLLGEVCYYHIVSRVVGNEFLLGDVEKEKLLEIIKRFSAFYFVQVIGYSIMDNHFHLLIRMDDGGMYGDDEILSRVEMFYDEEKKSIDISHFRRKLEDLSEYVKGIKQSFSVWYNRFHDRKGYFWGDRFKSLIIGNLDGLFNCLAYIDLNSVRAGLVRCPEAYRWSSIGYWVQSGNLDDFLSFKDIFYADREEMLSFYREYLYHSGGIEKLGEGRISQALIEREMLRGFRLGRYERFRYRVRYFTDGLVIGGKGYINWAYNQFGENQIMKADRRVYRTGVGKRIFSIRRLNSSS